MGAHGVAAVDEAADLAFLVEQDVVGVRVVVVNAYREVGQRSGGEGGEALQKVFDERPVVPLQKYQVIASFGELAGVPEVVFRRVGVVKVLQGGLQVGDEASPRPALPAGEVRDGGEGPAGDVGAQAQGMAGGQFRDLADGGGRQKVQLLLSEVLKHGRFKAEALRVGGAGRYFGRQYAVGGGPDVVVKVFLAGKFPELGDRFVQQVGQEDAELREGGRFIHVLGSCPDG